MKSVHRHLAVAAALIRNHAPYLLIIILLTGAVYGRTVSFEFLTNWDDPQYITLNKVIRSFSWNNVTDIFSKSYFGNYAPLHLISYMIDYSIWGSNPSGFHLTSALLHAVNGMLVYALTARISGMKTAGLIAAIIFVSHPAQVESVAWLSQRKNLLSLFFFLVSFLSYLKSRQQDSDSRLFYLIAVVAFFASLLSKATAVVLPLCLVIHDITIAGNRPGKALWRRMIPFALAAGTMAIITAYTQQPETGGGRVPYHGGSPWTTFLTMLPVMVHYLKMMIFPFDLSALYIHQIKSGADAEVLMSAVAVAAVVAAGVICYRRSKPLFFWYAMFFIPLLPVSQIIPLVTLINDRYLYFPMIGAGGFAGYAVVLLCDKLQTDRKWALYCATALCAAYLAIASYQRSAVWQNSVTLWIDAAGKNPSSKDIVSMLAEAHKNAGQMPQAIEVYKYLFSLPGEFVDHRHEQEALRDAALVFMGAGLFTDAENLLLQLTEKYPKDSTGFAFLASCYNATGRKDAAEAAYLEALKISPDNPQGMIGLASLYLDMKTPDKAAALLAKAAAADAEGPDLSVTLARLAAGKGDYDQALTHLEQAERSGLFNPSRLVLLPEFAPMRDSDRFRRITAGKQ